MLEGLNESIRPDRRFTVKIALAGLALVVAAAIGVGLVFRFVADERARELRGWQARLGLTADSRAAAVNDWLDRQMAAVGGLADNASLQLYATELALASGDTSRVTEEPAQAGYLRNLLIVTADRAGFAAPPVGPRVAANVNRVGVAGLAVLAPDGRPLVVTPDMPPLTGRLHDFVATAKAGERAVEDMYLGAGGQPSMAFLAPVLAIQGDPGSRQVAWILGVREAGSELFPLLGRPPVAEKSAESMLVRRSDAVIEFLSPLADGAGPLVKRLAADTPRLAAAYAVETPGGFAILRDYRDAEVLVTGRRIALAPWTLVHKVDRGEALATSDARLNRLLAFLLLGVAAIAGALIAVWRHGASRRASDAARRFEALARRFDSQGKILRLVTDSQPAAIFIADAESRIRFANSAAGARAGAPQDDLIGKALASVFGPAQAQGYEKLNRAAIETQSAQSEVSRLDINGATRVLRTEHIPLPVAAGEPPGVLVVEDDITTEIVERERRERTLRQLVRTLVAIVDRRDPYAAYHSQRVAAVASRVAEEMGLDPVAMETAEIAGNLMNLGKILVPAQLLTRNSDLSDDEKRQIRESLQAGVDLLENIEFDGPVVETLRLAQERVDGAGPRGLKGGEIPVTARIVAVANAFVALVSARAHRPGVSFDEAVDILLKQAGGAFDRAVVVALVNDLDNRGGRTRWADFVRAMPPAG